MQITIMYRESSIKNRYVMLYHCLPILHFSSLTATTVCPTKLDKSKSTRKSSLTLELICDISRQPSYTCMILETITTNSPSSGISKMWSAFFVVAMLPEILKIL